MRRQDATDHAIATPEKNKNVYGVPVDGHHAGLRGVRYRPRIAAAAQKFRVAVRALREIYDGRRRELLHDGAISESRRVGVFSLHSNDSSPSSDGVGGLFLI